MTANRSHTILTTERFRVEEVTRTLPGGASKTRSIIRHPGAVGIVPMIDDDHVCLLRNYRVAVDRVLLEIPAGTREPNEPPLETAARELQEETGYRAGSLQLLASVYLSPGILDEQMHLYIAQDLQVGANARELGEEMENWIVPWHDAIELIAAGEIVDAKTIAALLLYDRRRAGK